MTNRRREAGKVRKLGKVILLQGLLFLITVSSLFAEDFPRKPINITATFSSGGIIDICFRLVAARAEKILGQPIVLSFNPGGGGSVGLGIIAKEKPDGYNLVGCSSSGLVKIPQFWKTPYSLEDFVPIIQFAAPPLALVVKSDSPWKTLKEFLEYAKKNPGKVTYAAIGAGTSHHLAMEYIAKQEGGIQWTMVPYGGRPGLAAVLGGHITAISGTSDWIPHVKEGTLRILAFYSRQRSTSFPDVPTLRELGYDFSNDDVTLVAAPKGTPRPIVKKLEEALHKGMEDPGFIQNMNRMAVEIAYRNSEDTKKYLEETYIAFGKLIKDLKVKVPNQPGDK